MLHSLKFSHWAVHIGLAAVFMWFGVHKFVEPVIWLNAWVPQSILDLLAALGMSGENFIFLNGIFEVLVAVSLVSGYFIRIFAAAAAVFLVLVFAFHAGGPTDVVMRDVGLVGGLAALVFWPERTQW